MAKNVIVAQSGGPSPVINSSLRGIIETCRMFPDKFGKVYGGWHGIEGVLNEELLDLSFQKEEEIAPAVISLKISNKRIFRELWRSLKLII
jgi:6-phosphofructokinase